MLSTTTTSTSTNLVKTAIWLAWPWDSSVPGVMPTPLNWTVYFG